MSVLLKNQKLKEPIRILAISDLHFWDKEELNHILDYEFDVCVLLGDIPYNAIVEIVNIVKDKPIFGLPGNHDAWNIFEEFPVVDLHEKTEDFHTYCFAGFGGSLRYKKGPYAMVTQEECLKSLKKLPKGDILLTHDSMYRLFGKDGAHEGLKGITRYILKNHIRLNIHGHHHQMSVKKRFGCTTVCVYRCAVITYPEITVEQVF